MAPEAPVDPALIGALLGLFSHDLRNPLTALVANLSFMRTRSTLAISDPLIQATLSDSLVACSALQLIITNLQTLGDALTSTSVRLQSVQGAQLAREAMTALQSEAEMKNICVTWRDTTEGASIRVDRNLAVLALENLLANSLAHSSDGQEVTFQISLPSSKIVRFEIHDQGASVPEDLGKLLFALEGQVQFHHSGSRYGRGLGLWVASFAAQATGGVVRVSPLTDRTTTTEGSSFILELPTG